MLRFIFVTCLSLILTGCISSGSWIAWGPSPEERLFTAGLDEWRAEDENRPEAFGELTQHYPDSPFAAAAETLVDCARVSSQLSEDNVQMREQLQKTEAKLAQALQDLEKEHEINSALADRLQELETSLDKFKQILIETEQHSP